jgi:hypothetical protein
MSRRVYSRLKGGYEPDDVVYDDASKVTEEVEALAEDEIEKEEDEEEDDEVEALAEEEDEDEYEDEEPELTDEQIAAHVARVQQYHREKAEAEELKADKDLEMQPENLHVLPTVDLPKIQTVPMTAEQKIREAQRLMREARLELTPYDVQPMTNALLATGERTYEKKSLLVKNTYVPQGRGGDRLFSIPFNYAPSNRIN